MSQGLMKKILFFPLGIAGILIGIRYLFPTIFPFLLGAILAMSAEPAAKLLCERLHCPRWAATGLAVSGVFILFLTLLTILLTLLMRQLGHLSSLLPQLTDTVHQGMLLLKNWLLSLAQQAPEGIQEVLTQFVKNLFSGSSTLLEDALTQFPQLITKVLGSLSDGLFTILTGIISGYMISVRLPVLKKWLHTNFPAPLREHCAASFKELRKGLGGWLSAQIKLTGVAFLLLNIGFFMLKIPNSILWAFIVTLVDIFPILGVGTILIPWSIVAMIQGNFPLSIGLLGIYATVWLTRSVLEPKLIGKGLGLDPLLTLIAIYAGFRLMGIAGMLLAPVFAMAIAQILKVLRH